MAAALGVLALGLVMVAAGWTAPSAFAGEEERELLQRLKKGGVEQRRQTLMRLGRQGGQGAVPALVEALRDFDPVSRALAEQALWSIWMRSGDARVDALLQNGTRLMTGGKLEKAVEVFDRVIRLRPGFAEGYNKRATAMYHLGRFQHSLDDIEQTLRRNPYHFGALSGAGLCLLGLKRPREAMNFFQRALRINPNMKGIIELKKRVEGLLRKPMT
ncbi:MAG: tetratricopeptide repeat protein [bacterium]